MKNKGIMGLDTAKAFIVGLLGLVIVGVLTMVIFGALTDTTLVGPDTESGSVTNETGAYINATGYTLDKASETGFSSPAITAAYNYTDNTLIGSGNYTVSDAGVVTNTTTTNYDNVSISYTYNYETTSNEEKVVNNASSGISDFFSNTSVWLSLLGVVIIILIIAAVVSVVNRFGSEQQSARPTL